jgi:hypothetical protein
MSIKNSEMPAMPARGVEGHPFNSYTGWPKGTALGLTKLEHFAGLAMQGHLAGDLECIATAKQVAAASVEYAKYLLAELEKQQ